VLVAGALLAGCSLPASSRAPREPPTTRAPREPPTTRAPRKPPLARALTFCPARRQLVLAGELSRAVPLSRRHELVPLGVSADGTMAYVSAWTPRFAGVARLSLTTGALRPIHRFANPASDQAFGAWGGRWLVWEETTSLQSLDNFTVLAWDSVTGRVTRLGHSLAGPGGTPWPSPWRAPAVSGDYAAWAQGYAAAGLVEIRLANLRTGRVTVVRRGHVQAPFFAGRLLAWPESDRPGAVTSLRAADPATGKAAALPPVLGAIRGTDFVASDGAGTAYLGPSLTTLYYSPAPDLRASAVLRLPAGVSFSGLGMGRNLLAWTTTRATFVASTLTGRYLQVTPAYGFAVTGRGSTVLVSDPPGRQARHPALALHVLDAAAVARCR
jgi:hypothetical protein